MTALASFFLAIGIALHGFFLWRAALAFQGVKDLPNPLQSLKKKDQALEPSLLDTKRRAKISEDLRKLQDNSPIPLPDKIYA